MKSSASVSSTTGVAGDRMRRVSRVHGMAGGGASSNGSSTSSLSELRSSVERMSDQVKLKEKITRGHGTTMVAPAGSSNSSAVASNSVSRDEHAAILAQQAQKAEAELRARLQKAAAQHEADMGAQKARYEEHVSKALLEVEGLRSQLENCRNTMAMHGIDPHSMRPFKDLAAEAAAAESKIEAQIAALRAAVHDRRNAARAMLAQLDRLHLHGPEEESSASTEPLEVKEIEPVVDSEICELVEAAEGALGIRMALESSDDDDGATEATSQMSLKPDCTPITMEEDSVTTDDAAVPPAAASEVLEAGDPERATTEALSDSLCEALPDLSLEDMDCEMEVQSVIEAGEPRSGDGEVSLPMPVAGPLRRLLDENVEVSQSPGSPLPLPPPSSPMTRDPGSKRLEDVAARDTLVPWAAKENLEHI